MQMNYVDYQVFPGSCWFGICIICHGRPYTSWVYQ